MTAKSDEEVKEPAEWRVRAVYRGVSGVLLEVTLAGEYGSDHKLPEPGDILVVKPKEIP